MFPPRARARHMRRYNVAGRDHVVTRQLEYRLFGSPYKSGNVFNWLRARKHRALTPSEADPCGISLTDLARIKSEQLEFEQSLDLGRIGLKRVSLVPVELAVELALAVGRCDVAAEVRASLAAPPTIDVDLPQPKPKRRRTLVETLKALVDPPPFPKLEGRRLQILSPALKALPKGRCRHNTPRLECSGCTVAKFQDLRDSINDELEAATEAFVHGADGPVAALAGERGLRARQPIDPHTLFPVCCSVLTEREFFDRYPDWASSCEAERFSYQFIDREPIARALTKAGEPSTAVIADLRHSDANRVGLINDARGSGQPPNVEFVELVARGWPFLFIKTLRPIVPGEELLLSYGEDYWESAAARLQRLSGQALSKLRELVK